MKTTAFNSPEKRKLGGRERGREYTRRYSAIILRYRFPGLMRTRLAASRETVRSEAKGVGRGRKSPDGEVSFSPFAAFVAVFSTRRGYSSLNVLTVSPPYF